MLFVLPNISAAFATSRQPNIISTTLAFDNGKIVTVQYSQIYFCDVSFGQDTSTTSNPCVVGTDATGAPVKDVATSTLNVIVPAFLPPICGALGIPCLSGSDLASLGFTPGSTNTVLDPTLGGNDLTQCPDNKVAVALTCPNHPAHLNLIGALLPSVLTFGNIPLPIHSHIISGNGVPGINQGGWWELHVWLVLDPSVWPNNTDAGCSAGSGCINSNAALAAALTTTPPDVAGPVPTTIYLFFNVVSSNSK